MKIYEGTRSGVKMCRMCDKKIKVRHIVLEFNSVQKAFFHLKCWKEFQQQVRGWKKRNTTN